MSFELAQKVADAVLYEGYVLYPYRASAAKNRFRWQFGVVVPRGYADAGGGESWAMQTECLIEPENGSAEVDLRVRFLQVQARSVEESAEGGGDEFRAVESLEVDGRQVVTWEEGVEVRVDAPALPLAQLLAGELVIPMEVAEGRDVEPVNDAAGGLRGRLVRERWPISGLLRVAAQPVAALGDLVKLRVRIENLSPWPVGAETIRGLALRQSLNGAHTLLGVRGGVFLSLIDPPEWARAAAGSCVNQHTWPVLAGGEDSREVMLSSPIILYDHPEVAPESSGDLFDATEIDEILTLRIMTLTEEEKREARGTDERAREIIERSDSIPAELFERLHGAVRSLSGPVAGAVAGPAAGPAAGARPREKTALEGILSPDGEVPPEEASVEVAGVRIAKNARVRLHPSRRADSMDMFLEGRAARVEGVFRDVEDVTYVAVVLDDDPASELHSWYGRFFYFYPEEIEPLGSPAGSSLDRETTE